MTTVDQLARYRSLLTWTFVGSLPLLAGVHAPLLPSDAMPHRAYHALESVIGGSALSAVVHLGFLIPAVSLLGLVVVAVIGRRTQGRSRTFSGG